jgi:3-methyladenine DNA glycosylase AlkD
MNAHQIQEKLRSLSDPAVAASSLRFFKKEHAENDVFLGLRAATLRQLAKEYRQLPLSEVETLLHSDIHEERMLALLILVLAVRKATDSTRQQIHDFYLANTRFINNWDLVDASAPSLVGAYLMDKSRKPLYRLAKSTSVWERRIAIVATQHFIRNDDFDFTLKIAKLLLEDQEDLIHKATGWMLREVADRNRGLLIDFLKPIYRKMPRTMLRYAIEKFGKVQRDAYLKGRV